MTHGTVCRVSRRVISSIHIPPSLKNVVISMIHLHLVRRAPRTLAVGDTAGHSPDVLVTARESEFLILRYVVCQSL